MEREAVLILEDGTQYRGRSFGYEKSVSGELVFYTAMTGYPESLSDPSYKGQILVPTFPLIGNYGVPGDETVNGISKFYESDRIQCSALVISQYSAEYSHWDSAKSLGEWLKKWEVPGIYGIDTRALTKRLREKGAMLGKIVFGDEDIPFYDPNKDNLVSQVSCPEIKQYGNGKYTFSLYKNVSGKKYSEEGKISLTADMPDELSAFLYPNQYVNYDTKTAAVKEAESLCGGMNDQKQIYQAVCDYMKGHFAYDYIKSVSVKPGQLPDIDDAWNKHMGICQDLSAIMVAMLRSQGVPARLMIGTLNASTYHAWVTAVVNGEEEFFDPTAALNAVSNGSYTVERYY